MIVLTYQMDILDQNPNITPIMTFGNLTSGSYEIRVEVICLHYKEDKDAQVRATI